MSKAKSSRNGSGDSICFVDFPTATVETSTIYNNESCDGFVASSDGTVQMQLTRMDAPVTVTVLAGAYNHYSVDTLMDGGSVPITDIMLFWK